MKNDVISKIDNDSPLLHKAHIGDEIVSINGNVIHDVLDYKYFSYDPVLHITLRRPDGTEHIVRVQKPEGRDLGLEFSEYLMDNPRSCANNCVFCFIASSVLYIGKSNLAISEPYIHGFPTS